MAFDTFDFRVENMVQSNPELRSIAASFGDGYEQVSKAGINNEVDKISLKCCFAPKDSSEADRLQSFIRSHGSFTPFYFRKPGDTTTKKWRLESYSSSVKTVNQTKTIREFDLKLKQSFTPDLSPPTGGGNST